MPTIAETVVHNLAANGIQRIWGVPGDSLNAVTEAIRREKGIEWMLTRHEEEAAFAAAGEAALTGELAVCAGSCGPGNMHLINGLYDAHRSRVPVLAIASHIPSDEIGSQYFQETRPTELFRDCTVFCEMVLSPEQMPRLLEIAMRTAIEKRGVAVLIMAGDTALEDAKDERVFTVRRTNPVTVPSPAELQEAAATLNSCEKVTILAGAGVEGAREEVLALADALGAPIVHALRGKEFIEHDNPFDVGMTGLLGFASGYRAMEDCDALLMLGTDFPYQQFYPKHAKILQVDIRGEQLGRRVPLTQGMVGGVRETAEALLPLLERKSSRTHLEKSLDHYRRTRRQLDDLEKQGPGAIHPQHLAHLIDELADDDAVFLPDVGTPVIWACRHLHIGARRRLIGSFWHGTMAAATPLGLGVQAVDRNRQVVILAGDGGLAMMLGELLTAVQHRLPIKIVVFDNAALSFVEVEMKAAGIVNFGTGLQNPDFGKVAQAVGMHGESVTRPEDLEGALRRAFEYDGPALVSVAVERQELSMPPKIDAKQATGFAVYAMRTVLAGNGRELIDLAKANARQLL
ncbi:ubiquinone-dependent pyruvate dehydrogenase [Arthrobacter sp. zg-Y20]|uniref:ubiquinone-dependent pyruvate dehydrogenase n=1 Tax=unclassified Arthrobacter TaxID=235627 RepID=UPI001D15361E|nr:MULTISPECIES: ubiquinone-dependent pyruvate dehydrogenase [unclassified Arthrobacter]MCC3276200.1 ubiquinone-dependent pyruvate dehydrogenase [Arthrobacter sp. zg-Y20]MDK1316360.1 ubiquinone-dependent pyruvate dehydrogenase [Arthrobacter sp. zg.Y20]WIB06408.1 ubiquinone-dependent pyruvate dehydrogenase [Arthrobacter sp. zg-Y20]